MLSDSVASKLRSLRPSLQWETGSDAVETANGWHPRDEKEAIP